MKAAWEIQLIAVMLPDGLGQVLIAEVQEPTRDSAVGLNYCAAALRGAASFLVSLVFFVMWVLDEWPSPLFEVGIVTVFACSLGVLCCAVRLMLVKWTPGWSWAVPRDVDLLWQFGVALAVFWTFFA